MFLFSLMKRKRGKNQFLNYFWRTLLKLEQKVLKIHKLSWLLITWILKKLNSIQTLVENIPEIKLSHWYPLGKTYKKSHLKTGTPLVLNKFVCYPSNRLFALWIGLFQKKKQGRGLRIWNLQGYQRNSVWNIQGLIKNEIEFPRVIKKK